MDKQYDDEKKGYLWHENDAVIERKGSFVINGEKKYGAIVKSFNAQNEAKYEMMMSIGLLHLNTDKQSDKTPDMGGKVTVDGVVYKQGCWAKESKDGIPFTSLGFQEVNDQSNGNEQPVADKKVPF
jgi:hypothetical protein|tara:strand:- start:629 stop:1006 length:378 start_codon:yes stop_codon:yes gene_type:complete